MIFIRGRVMLGKEYYKNQLIISKNLLSFYEKSLKTYKETFHIHRDLHKSNPSNSVYKQTLDKHNEHIKEIHEKIKQELERIAGIRRKYLQRYGREEMKLIRGGIK
jgi:NAD+--asparagine ADP-ribosyltransferase